MCDGTGSRQAATPQAGWTQLVALALLVLAVLSCVPVQARAQGIVEVLQRSQQVRLAQRLADHPARPDSAASARVRASFNRLLALLPASDDAELTLVGGPLYAEALFGRRAVAVSESVGELPEGERLLLLAHELGHLRLLHWQALSGLYLRLIPGEVTPATTEPVAERLGAQAHQLSHRQEFEADAFGFTLVRKLGFGVETAMGLLIRQGLVPDNATHPGTRRRVAQLRVLDSRLNEQVVRAGEDEAVAVSPAGDLH